MSGIHPTDLAVFRRPLIFGGTFDPPHLAHVALPRQVAKAIDADVIFYIPAARSPHKVGTPQTPAEHRLAMLRLALQDEPNALVVTHEIESTREGRPSYTVDTLEALKKQLHPDALMRLLIGTDQALAFDRWREPDRIIELAEPVVMIRPPETLDDLPEAWQQRVVHVDELPISSTDIRDRVAHGRSINELVHPAVADYIIDHSLYQ